MTRIFLLCFAYFVTNLFAGSAITYEFSGGRFGDNVLSYLHAKWLAYHYQLPLLYKPFPYSSELILDDLELHYDDCHCYYQNAVLLDINCPRPNSPNTLFVCPYFPEIDWELNRQTYFTFPVSWKNPTFRNLVKTAIAPKHPLTLTFPPGDALSVAIHMREGGGFDDDGHKIKHPVKTPPVTFYSDSLNKLLELFPDQKIHCHIFTDALDPNAWITKILQALPAEAPITFTYRQEHNCPDSNVLEDFFSFFNFDILIRAESNYSIVASLIHNFMLVLYPYTFSITDRIVTIDQIKMEINTNCFNMYEPTLQKILQQNSEPNTLITPIPSTKPESILWIFNRKALSSSKCTKKT